MNTLANVIKALNEAVDQLGGQEQAIAICDRMYSQSFIGEPVKLKDCEYVNNVEGEISILQQQVALHIYCLENNVTMPVYPNDPETSDYEFDLYYDDLAYIQELANDYTMNKYGYLANEDTLVTYTCNYKGEGEEEIVVYDLVKHLPTFKSKSESFYQCL